jgi:hypothetical protein
MRPLGAKLPKLRDWSGPRWWSRGPVRYALKRAPAVVVDVVPNEAPILFGTWNWIGPDGAQRGPFLKLQDVVRDMDRCFGLPRMVAPLHHWRRA